MPDFNQPDADTLPGEVPSAEVGPDESPGLPGELAEGASVEAAAEGAAGVESGEQPAGETQSDAPLEGGPGSAPAAGGDPVQSGLAQLLQQQQQQINLLTQIVQGRQNQQSPQQPAPQHEPPRLQPWEIQAVKAALVDPAAQARLPEHLQRKVHEILAADREQRVEQLVDPARYYSSAIKPHVEPMLAEVDRRVEERLRPIEQERLVREFQSALAPYQAKLTPADREVMAGHAQELRAGGFNGSPKELVAWAHARLMAGKPAGLAGEKQKLQAQQRQIDTNNEQRRLSAGRAQGGQGFKGRQPGEGLVSYSQRLQRAVSSGEITEQQLTELGG